MGGSDKVETKATTPDTSYLSLLGASNLVGRECVGVNADYIRCKVEDENPAKCVSQGEKVTACTLRV